MGWIVEIDGEFVPFDKQFEGDLKFLYADEVPLINGKTIQAYDLWSVVDEDGTIYEENDIDKEYKKFLESARGYKGKDTFVYYSIQVDGKKGTGWKLWPNGRVTKEEFIFTEEMGSYIKINGNWQYVVGRKCSLAVEIKPSKEAIISEPMESPMEKLNKLIGLSDIKDQVHTWMNRERVAQKRRSLGLFTCNGRQHMIFIGNPGTGKTTVARIMGGLMKEVSILKKGHVVEIDRSKVVGKYQGHSAANMRDFCMKALDGILFVDEAYGLVNGENDTFGQEAMDALVKCMEDYRDRLVVIFAGYPKEMKEWLETNSGMESRIQHWFYFKDYTLEEMVEIFKLSLNKWSLNIENVENVDSFLGEFLREIKNNARGVEKYFNKILDNQANRILLDGEVGDKEVSILMKEDFEKSPTNLIDLE